MPTAPGGASAREPSTSAGKSGAFASSDPAQQQININFCQYKAAAVYYKNEF